MKILLLYSYNRGFLSNFFTEISRKLSLESHEVTVFCLKNKKAKFSLDNVKVSIQKKGGYFSNYYKIYTIIKQVNPDIVISNFSYVNPALLFGRLLGVKQNIVWFHTVYGHSKPSKRKVYIKKFFLKLADRVIANSLVLQKEMNTIYGVDKKKLASIPFWTNISDFRQETSSLGFKKDPDYFYIGCPGRLVSDKNHETVLKAVTLLESGFRGRIRILIAGDGPYHPDLVTCVEKNNLSDNVIFLGMLSAEQMVDFYENMNLIVLPSLHEAFGLVFIEAISLGIPVLVSKAFGALGFLDQKDYPLEKFTFNPESEEELKVKLIPYLSGNGLSGHDFKSMYLSTFDKEIIFEKLLSLLEDKAN